MSTNAKTSSRAHPCHDSTHGGKALAAPLCPDRDVDRPRPPEAAFQHPIGPERCGKGGGARGEARLNQRVSDIRPEGGRPAGHGSRSKIESQLYVATRPRRRCRSSIRRWGHRRPPSLFRRQSRHARSFPRCGHCRRILPPDGQTPACETAVLFRRSRRPRNHAARPQIEDPAGPRGCSNRRRTSVRAPRICRSLRSSGIGSLMAWVRWARGPSPVRRAFCSA